MSGVENMISDSEFFFFGEKNLGTEKFFPFSPFFLYFIENYFI
jgi:hypothetical protein